MPTIGVSTLRTLFRHALSFRLPTGILVTAFVCCCCFLVWAGHWSTSALATFFLVRVTLSKDPVATEMLNLHTLHVYWMVRSLKRVGLLRGRLQSGFNAMMGKPYLELPLASVSMIADELCALLRDKPL